MVYPLGNVAVFCSLRCLCLIRIMASFNIKVVKLLSSNLSSSYMLKTYTVSNHSPTKSGNGSSSFNPSPIPLCYKHTKYACDVDLVYCVKPKFSDNCIKLEVTAEWLMFPSSNCLHKNGHQKSQHWLSVNCVKLVKMISFHTHIMIFLYWYSLTFSREFLLWWPISKSYQKQRELKKSSLYP